MTNRGCLHAGLTILAVVSMPLSAQTHFMSSLDGAQQVPVPVVTTAVGTANLMLNEAQDTLTYSVTLTGLDLDGLQTPGDATDDVTAMHFHRAPAGSNGAVVFGLISPNHDLDDLIIDPVAGTLSGDWEESDSNGNSPLSAELENLVGGGLYLNVHTNAVGSGEIRGQVVQTTLSDGLQLHIEFENTVVDSSPNGFDGQASGGVQYAAGVIGQAAVFDGEDGRVLFPTFLDALVSDNDFSVAFWSNLEIGSVRSVFGKREFCFASLFFDIRQAANGRLNFELADSITNYVVSATPATPGWHHFAFTRSGIDLQAFLDGELVDEDVTPQTLDLTNPATLGLSNSPCIDLGSTRFLKGSIDDLRVYNRLLMDSEIASLWNIFADGFESSNTSAWSSSVP